MLVNYKGLELLLEKTKEAIVGLKKVSKTEEIIFVKFFTAYLKYCNKKWYLAHHMT